MVVLDDIHHVDDERCLQMLRWLLEYAPDNLHVAFGSRAPLPLALSLSKLKAAGQAAEFDLRDLRFSLNESEQFLRAQLGNITRRDVQALHELTDGWVAGLQLFAIDLKGKRGADFLPMEMRDAPSFALYFEREVLVHLAPEDLDLLMHSAITNRFCASLCATLMGQPGAVARMTSRLLHLDREELFVSQISGEGREAWYRIHPLLREVLLDRLAQRIGSDLLSLHAAAWRWFDAHEHLDEAVRHAVLAGDTSSAADLVEAAALDLLARGDLPQLGSLVRRLPDDVVRARPRLRMLVARLRLYSRNLVAAEADIAAMEAEAHLLEPNQRHALVLLRGGLALQRDDTDAVLAIRAMLEAMPEDADSFALARRSHILAWFHMTRGEHGRAHALLDASAQQDISPDRHLVGESFRGMSFALEGRMADADSLLRDVLHQAAGVPDAAIACVAAGLLSDPLYEANELSEVCALIEPRLDLLERMAIPDAVLRAFMALSSAHWAMGNRLEATAVVERLEEYGTRHSLDRLLVHALALRLNWRLRDGALDEADALMRRMEALHARHAQALPGTHYEIARVALRARALISMHWNDFGGAAQRFRELLITAADAKRWREVVRTHLHLAVAESGNGQAAESDTQLLAGLHLGHRLGLVRSVLDISPGIPRMLSDLLRRRAQDPVMDFYVRRLLAAASQGRDKAAAVAAENKAASAASVAVFSDREREVLQLVSQAMPNKKIARVLGVTPHTVKWHLRKIYLKLGVAERDQAVARLRDLSLPDGPAPGQRRT